MKQPMQHLTRTIISVLSVAAIISCSSSSAEKSGVKVTPLVKVTEPATKVTTTLSEVTFFEYRVTSNGKIKSANELLFISEASARVAKCMVQNNKRVSMGSMLVQFDAEAVQRRIERAEMTRFNAEKEYQSQLLGYENLLKDKTAMQADTIRRKLRISSGLATAEQDIKEAQVDLSKSTITAPFAGVLSNVQIQQGQQVKAGDEMFRIYDPLHFLLEVTVLEADIPLLKPGVVAEVSPVVNVAVKYRASLSEVNPHVDENGMVLVRLVIRNPSGGNPVDGYLFPGMNCLAVIRIPFQKVLLVPKEAVVMRGGRAVVFTIEDSIAKWNYVTIGRDNGEKVEILNGLSAGRKVITSNNIQLAHNAPVKEDTTDMSVIYREDE